MFRWCAYCQRLLGESPPFDDYRVTHGLCAPCEESLDDFESTPERVKALRLHRMAFQRWHLRELTDTRAFVNEALASGIPSSEILIGVLQPALYEIGEQWKRAHITVNDEHRFTAWCETVMSLLPASPHPDQDPAILLTALPGNQHTLGVRFVDRLLLDANIQSRYLPFSSDTGLLRFCQEKRPGTLGISVSMPETIPRALALAREIQARTGVRVLLGGFACRPLEPCHIQEIPILSTFNEILPFFGVHRDLG